MVELAAIEQFAHLFSHLFGPYVEKFFGTPAIFGGTILAFGGWFGDYAVIEWRRRRAYSLVMWGVAALLVGFVFYLDWTPRALFRCVVWAVLFYLPLHLSARGTKFK
jgi:hypothetical protein